MPLPEAVLVTGAARRLGKAIALHVAGQGFDIALHYNHSREEAEKTAGEIRALGRACMLFEADLGAAEVPEKLAREVQEAMPHCLHLVNSASIFERLPFGDANADTLDRHMAINFRAPVLLARAFLNLPLPLARECRGEGGPSIVNLLDVRITDQSSPYFDYMVSKRALAEFTRMAAVEMRGVARINALLPGSVLESVDGRFPARSKSTAEDVARAVHRLLTDAGANGEFVVVD